MPHDRELQGDGACEQRQGQRDSARRRDSGHCRGGRGWRDGGGCRGWSGRSDAANAGGDSGNVRPRENRVPAGRAPCAGRLHNLPRPAGDEGPAEVRPLRRLPPGRPQGRLQASRLRRCHKETGFKGGTFDHAAKTRFPLDGKHAAVACASCHKGAAAGPGRGRGEAKRRLPRRPAGMRFVPRRRPQGTARDVVPDVPLGGVVPGGDVQAPAPPGVLRRRPRHGLLRQVPRGRSEGRGDSARERENGPGTALQGRFSRVLLLPQGPASRPGRERLRDLPRCRRREVRAEPASITRRPGSR